MRTTKSNRPFRPQVEALEARLCMAGSVVSQTPWVEASSKAALDTARLTRVVDARLRDLVESSPLMQARLDARQDLAQPAPLARTPNVPQIEVSTSIPSSPSLVPSFRDRQYTLGVSDPMPASGRRVALSSVMDDPYQVTIDLNQRGMGGNDGRADTIRITQNERGLVAVYVNGTVLGAESARLIRNLRILGSNDNDRVELSGEITCPVEIKGGFGANVLQGADRFNDWHITGHNSGHINVGATQIAFSAMATLEGGNEGDLFQFEPAGRIAGAINGRGGPNTLGYTAFNTGVNVNLGTGLATRIGLAPSGTAGAVSGIQHVLGGAAGDVLIGDGNVNILVGGGGDDSLSGQGGVDYLYGETGDDTLDGGDECDVMDGGADNDTVQADRAGEDIRAAEIIDIALPVDSPQMDSWSCGPNAASRILRAFGHADATYGQLINLVQRNSFLSDLEMGSLPEVLARVMSGWEPSHVEKLVDLDRIAELVQQGVPVVALVRSGTRTLDAATLAVLATSVPNLGLPGAFSPSHALFGALAGATGLVTVPVLHYVAVKGVDVVNQKITYVDSPSNTGRVDVSEVSYSEFYRMFNWSTSGLAKSALDALDVQTRTIIVPATAQAEQADSCGPECQWRVERLEEQRNGIRPPREPYANLRPTASGTGLEAMPRTTLKKPVSADTYRTAMECALLQYVASRKGDRTS